MSLPSQTGRFSSSGRSNSNMYRRRRNAPKPLLIAGGLALVLALAGWLLLRGGSVEGADIPPAANAAQSAPVLPLGPQSAAASPTTRTTARQERAAATPLPPEPQPVEVRQGRPATPPERTDTKQATPTSPATATPPTPTPSRTTTETPERTQTPIATPIHQPTAMTSHAGGSTLAAAHQRLADGDLVTARLLFSRALRESRPESERAAIREELTRINDDLVFSRRIAPDDPWAYAYRVQPNDALARINQRQGLAPDWRLIQRINGMSNPNRLQVGQTLKLLRGPFHAVVHKSEFRLDLYMGPAGDEDQWLFIRSFDVGLGEGGSTPEGTFVVRRNSKLINPHWINPRTGEHFASDDPKNPIGNRWIGLEGIGDSAGYVGYGLHGTIDPDSIGREMSMGCVRMLDDDINLIFELLGEQVSVVQIEP